ncbi:UDP-N-acetyl-D-glucosamine dehydrogenase [Paenibacillus sp. 32O-W]|nr:UDP-N-acetyl-D-glucosamine dehydrogenase [Paenibacillus sp. 32O-W]
MNQIRLIQKDKVAVVGLGYVGLPLAVHIQQKGYPVIGIDKDKNKLQLLQNGQSYIPDVTHHQIKEAMKAGFQANVPGELIRGAKYIIVCVPTPLDDSGEPELGALKSASAFISRNLQPGQTVIYESSTYPGTLEEVVWNILSKSGLKVGQDFYLGYSPERIDPGNHRYPLETIPKVISGLTNACKEKVNQFYSTLFHKTVPVSHPRVAEMCKLIENIQRLVNISLVNEIEIICESMNIDFRETLQAAATKPFGFTPYFPGPGIGGHCIPVDPLYFQWKAKKYGKSSKLIEAAHEINNYMPFHIAERIGKKLESLPGDPKEKKVLLIGLAYKKDVNDIRESSAIKVFKLLLQMGYQVEYHDPFVSNVTLSSEKYVSKVMNKGLLQSADLVVILTDHSNVDWSLVKSHAKAVIDTRGVI